MSADHYSLTQDIYGKLVRQHEAYTKVIVLTPSSTIPIPLTPHHFLFISENQVLSDDDDDIMFGKIIDDYWKTTPFHE